MPKEYFDLADHQLNGESEFQTHWGNFGYWQLESSYPAACEALATLLADAVDLNAQSHLLDCGFGSGEQLLTWINHYRVASIVGINLSHSQTEYAKHKISHLKPCNTKVALHQGDAVECLASHDFASLRDNISHIIALDCAYHFQDRALFFQKAYEALQPGGQIALTDFTFRTPPQTFTKKARLHITSTLIKSANIPKKNVISAQRYQQMIENAGFKNVKITDITAPVIQGFCQWLPRYQNSRASPANINWTKYSITVSFLNWAYRHDIIQYQLITASK